MSGTEAVMALGIGLGGSLHCLGMCGPLALALPGFRDRSPIQKVLLRLLYHLGRVITYSMMGFFFWVLGQTIRVGQYQQTLSIVMGSLLILSIVYPPKWIPAWISRNLYVPLKKRLGEHIGKANPGSQFIVGMLNGLLPCGLVVAALAYALVQGNAFTAAGFMALFGIGTIPMMLSVSLGATLFSKPSLKPVTARLIPGVTFVVGLLLIVRGMGLGIPYISPEFVLDEHGETEVHSCCPHNAGPNSDNL